MKVICEKYPELQVHDLGVRFRRGAAEVENVDTLRKLSAMQDYGFAFDGEIPAAKSTGRGKKADDGTGDSE